MYENGIPPLPRIGRSVTGLADAQLRALRVIAKPPLRADYSPDGTYISVRLPDSSPTVPSPAQPTPWRISDLTQPADGADGSLTVTECLYYRAGILASVDSLTVALPAAGAGWRYLVAKISAMTDAVDLTVVTTLQEVLVSSRTDDTHFYLLLYKLSITDGVWAIVTDCRLAPSIAMYA